MTKVVKSGLRIVETVLEPAEPSQPIGDRHMGILLINDAWLMISFKFSMVFIHAKRKNKHAIVGLVGSDSLTGWFHNHFIGG